MDGQPRRGRKRRRRAQIIMEQQYGVMEGFNRSQIGRRLTVAVEGREGRLWYGRSHMDAPDIDSRVYFSGHGRTARAIILKLRSTAWKDTI